jgi:cysteine desulfurase / selenocysteine lyase
MEIGMATAPGKLRASTPPPSPQTEGDVDRYRRDFPILSRVFHGRPLVYLDNAATTQKPTAVIDCLEQYYKAENANIHRGVYLLSQEATNLYEAARGKVQKFLGAAESREIVFTRGTTESINLVAATYGGANLKAGDEIVVSGMEHHSNIVPWQLLCGQTGAVIRVAPFNDRGELLMDEYEKLLNPRTKIVAMVHLSNSLGTINPVDEIIKLAHRHGAVALLDGAQWAAHGPTNVRALDADFYAFSGHKLYGPTGIGALYAKAALLEKMPPYQGGGDMIKSVTFAETTYADPPHRFEAGTPHIAGAIGLGAAIDYITKIGLDKIAAHETRLLDYATAKLSEIDGVRLIGTARKKGSVLSFVTRNIHPHDIGTVLDAEGIAVRTGHHCCQPVMDRFAIPATARASLAFYNTTAEIDALAAAVRKAIEMFQ